ncbi:MAG: Rrf2 family transcriptional regulator [Actinobacteria bacterium]|nr:Rrf2 family transcriptional regulator [Actinomycetota bacterium]
MHLGISRKTELALKAISVLSSTAAGQSVPGRELAEQIGTTTRFLPQVMKPLVNHKYATSSPGPSGGYRLAIDLTDTTLLQVIEAIEGPFDLGKCISTGGPCPDQASCALHIPWTRAKTAVLTELGSVMLDVMYQSSESEG